MTWTFNKIIKAKDETEAKQKFKEWLEQERFRRWDFKIISCYNSLQYPETFSIHYRGRFKKGQRY